MDVSECHTRLQVLLGDTGIRYSTALLDESVAWALDALSAGSPQLKTEPITVTSAGREQSLASLPGLLTVLEVIYPHHADVDAPEPLRQWYFYRRDGAAWLYLGGRLVPTAGDLLRVSFTARHTLQGLDGALLTTLLPEHETLLLQGASGRAAELHSLHMVEAYGKKSSEPDKLKSWAEAALAEFRQEVQVLKTSRTLMNVLNGGWKLDRWDN